MPRDLEFCRDNGTTGGREDRAANVVAERVGSKRIESALTIGVVRWTFRLGSKIAWGQLVSRCGLGILGGNLRLEKGLGEFKDTVEAEKASPIHMAYGIHV